MSIRPPRVRMITFHSCHCLIYCKRFVQYRISLCTASSSVSIQPYMRFLFVSASICVRLPSDSTSRWTPLSFANSSYCKACSGLSPPSYHPCRAHCKKIPSLVRDEIFVVPPLFRCKQRHFICLTVINRNFIHCTGQIPKSARGVKNHNRLL